MRMVEPRFLPHLAAACRELLGDDDVKHISPATRSAVAMKAGVGQPTVDRFLAAKNFPRSSDLDRMVASVAAVAEADWWEPWRLATERAKDAKVEWAKFLSGELPIATPEPHRDEPGGERRRRPRR